MKIIVLFSIIAITSCGRPHYMDCGGTGHLDEVNVFPCDDPKTCVFKRGEKASINVLFTTASAHEEVTTNVIGDVHGVKVPFPLEKCTNACDGCGMVCPLVKNKQYNFTITLTVQKYYPAIPVVVQLALKDPSSKGNIVCSEISVKLT